MEMSKAMIIVIENGLPTCVNFMVEIRVRGLTDLKGWWWSSDKGLISDPSDSDEFVMKAQTIYDALTGKPVYINGVRIYGKHSPTEISQMLDVNRHDILHPEPDTVRPLLPPRNLPGAATRTSSMEYDPTVGKSTTNPL